MALYEPSCMEDITVDINTPKNMEATVISVLLLFRHRFLQAMIKFDLISTSIY